jgi:hypothetical protein
MAYLGNKPVNNFVSFAKQDITGNGGTSYSLDYPVTGANDIELYINNVRQEPTEAYSCSGSTLTLTGSVSASDDVYVIFRGRALQTAQHPADSALEATSGSFSSAVDMGDHVVLSGDNKNISTNRDTTQIGISSNANQNSQGVSTIYWGYDGGSGFDGDIHYIVDSRGDSGRHRFYTWNGSGWTNTVNITSEGYHLTPKQPAFTAQAGTQYFLTSSQVVPFTNDSSNGGFDIGGNYNTSTYRFTAPVSGVYLVNVHVYKEVNQTMDVNVRVNGSIKGEIRNFTTNGNHEEFNGTWLWYLNANDYIDCYSEQAYLHLNSTMSQFSAVLIG